MKGIDWFAVVIIITVISWASCTDSIHKYDTELEMYKLKMEAYDA